ncbi:MAG: glycerol-3-phosphate dehydrogenase [Chloroflexota bacterium]|nr:glycerol-3-phosphate dehydrogenase [Chloroflexota bacterium]
MPQRPSSGPGEDRTFDLIVIGAGINGAGIARDAAMRGLRVLLLDKGDVSSGTSSWSTRLIHGGLRYLEHGELGLVRESLRERERLLRLAPHLVRPLPLLIPIYRGDRRGPWMIRAGMLAYDLLSLGKSLESHRMLSMEEALARAPGLDAQGLQGAAIYYDAQVEYAERLVLENALSARNHGAVIRTYCRVDELLVEGSTVRGVRYTDLLTGEEGASRASVTVNVAGPWVDEVLTGTGQSTRMVGGTKGSHLIVRPFPGAPQTALYVEARRDRRPYFIVPWNDLYLIGTTDVRYTGDLDRVVADEEEIEYLLQETNRVIPGGGLDRDAVLFTYAGIRPLPYHEHGSEGAITRRHVIHDHAPGYQGFLSIVGGKLTTYRSLAEQVVDRAYHKLGVRPPQCLTRSTPLPGAPAVPPAPTGGVELSAVTRRHLVRVYGSRAAEVLELARRHPELAAPLSEESGVIGAELVYAFGHELAVTLGDALLRRTMAGVGPRVGLDVLEAAAEIGLRYLGWDEARADREVAEYCAYIERFQPRELQARHRGAHGQGQLFR